MLDPNLPISIGLQAVTPYSATPKRFLLQWISHQIWGNNPLLCQKMSLQDDIAQRLRDEFPGHDLNKMSERLSSASSTPRIQRCILFASRGNADYFNYLCDLAKIDYRDVIIAGEYDRFDTQLYDFNLPFDQATIPAPYGESTI